MADHFAAFSFVDRITELVPGVRACAVFSVPRDVDAFPAGLVAEAVGQLAAWAAMAQIDFRGRPVAALATETLFHRVVAPGDRLQLAVEIETCDDDVVAYGGVAEVDGSRVIELKHCLGPMLPVADFDAPEALRERLLLLCGEGAPAGRFHGVAAPPLDAVETTAGRSVRATLRVPQSAPFFADHFPRRPVFPATLLLDSQIRLAMNLARTAIEVPADMRLLPHRMTNVKMRSFIIPGQEVELAAELTAANGGGTARLMASVGGRSVATARLDIALMKAAA
jgi:3-hydroxymyristoyl/3-hydroxydecanoyl-(acyl carrier protein) dehydratase